MKSLEQIITGAKAPATAPSQQAKASIGGVIALCLQKAEGHAAQAAKYGKGEYFAAHSACAQAYTWAAQVLSGEKTPAQIAEECASYAFAAEQIGGMDGASEQVLARALEMALAM